MSTDETAAQEAAAPRPYNIRDPLDLQRLWSALRTLLDDCIRDHSGHDRGSRLLAIQALTDIQAEIVGGGDPATSEHWQALRPVRVTVTDAGTGQILNDKIMFDNYVIITSGVIEIKSRVEGKNFHTIKIGKMKAQ